MSQVLKSISYSLAQDVSVADFLAASHAATTDLETLDGFIERKLLRAENGRWIDSVLWRDHQAADKSEVTIATLPGCMSCIKLMDHQNLEVRHDVLMQSSDVSVT